MTGTWMGHWSGACRGTCRPRVSPRTPGWQHWRAGAAAQLGAAVQDGPASQMNRRLSAVTAGAGPARQGVPGGRPPATAQPGAPVLRHADLLSADELPDGLVVADECGRVIIFNRAAERLTGISADHAIGRELVTALPLCDDEGRCWWRQSRPYDGLAIRTRHPERSLYLTRRHRGSRHDRLRARPAAPGRAGRLAVRTRQRSGA